MALLTIPSPLLAGRLVEPGPDTNNLMPLLLEVLIGDNVVMAHHFSRCPAKLQIFYIQ
jgi:hypothetical protein